MTKLAAIQMNSSDDLDSNLRLTTELVSEAKRQDAQLAVLPECFALMANSHEQRLECAKREHQNSTVARHLSALARQLNIWILGAGIFTLSQYEGKIRNTSYLIDDNGVQIERYDKVHLFDLKLSDDERYEESSYTEAGSSIAAVQSPVGKLGLTVCYDLRFPSFFQTLSDLGALVFVVPSAFTYTTGKAHWESLLRARAIENIAYVVAPAQWGEHANNRFTYGHSMVIDPWGKILVQAASGNQVLVCSIDLELVHRIRSRFTSLGRSNSQWC